MAQLTSICVYCGSSSGADPAYAAAAEDLGRLMAAAGVRLVYGGGAIGLMGIIARAVLVHGGEVTGIMPQFLKDREVMQAGLTETIVTADMHERKRKMFDRADAFVALPGGIGTLEETVEMMTWAQLGRHGRPVLLVNINGFWDPLSELLRHMAEQGFMKKAFLGEAASLGYGVVDSVGAVVPTLERALAGMPESPREASGETDLM